MKNRFSLLKSYLLGRNNFISMPIELVIEPTNRCNLSCIMCPREKIELAPQDMKLDLFKKIIKEGAVSLELVDFSFRGEPLMNDNIFAMVSYAKSERIKTYLSTNAILLDAKKSRELLMSGLDLLVISIDALTPESYVKIRKGGDFLLLMENIKALLECKKRIKNKTAVAVQIIPMIENFTEIDSFVRKWKNHPQVKAVKIKPFSTHGGLVENSLYVNNKQNVSVCNSCARIWRGFAVQSDGTVVPCCYDFAAKYPLGNLNSETLEGVWHGKKINELRRMHVERSLAGLKPCSDCDNLQVANIYQSATFIFDSLFLRKLLPFCNKFYKINKVVNSF